MAKRRTFAPEFKAQVVLEELTGVKDKAEIRRDVGIDVCDEQGDALRMVHSDEGGNFGEYMPYGIISVPSDGEYSFVTDSQRVVCVTKPMDTGAYVGQIGSEVLPAPTYTPYPTHTQTVRLGSPQAPTDIPTRGATMTMEPTVTFAATETVQEPLATLTPPAIHSALETS